MINNSIGIIGAGIMGQEVSFQLSKFNYNVALIDISEEVLLNAKDKINNISRFDLLMQSQGRSPKSLNKDIFSKIHFSTDINLVSDAEIIIENIPENINVKTALYKKLCNVINDKALIAVNTSAIPITQLSFLMKVPSNVLGIHFVNPVHLMSTVEMVKGMLTSEETIIRAQHFLDTMKMKCVLVNDSPGFISNRVMLVYINEAIFCLQENIAPAEGIDQIFRECLSHKMGPLQTADLIGLDTILYSLEVLYNEFNDSKYRPAFLLKQMVYSGLLGKKSSKGFYRY